MRTQKYEAKALNAFIEACKYGTVWAQARQFSALVNSGKTDYEVIALKIGCPRKWIEKMAKKPGSLEAATFIRFTQAYKWWEISDKGHNILFDPRWRD